MSHGRGGGGGGSAPSYLPSFGNGRASGIKIVYLDSYLNVSVWWPTHSYNGRLILRCTVKLANSGHSRETEKVAVIDRWLLFTGSLTLQWFSQVNFDWPHEAGDRFWQVAAKTSLTVYPLVLWTALTPFWFSTNIMGRDWALTSGLFCIYIHVLCGIHGLFASSSSCVWVSYAVWFRRRSQLTVSGLGLVRLMVVLSGGLRVGQSWITWCAVWSVCPQIQAADGRSPQRFMLWLKRPTPVRNRFKVTHSLRASSAPGGNNVFGWTVNWAGCWVSCQQALHASSMLKLELQRDAAWREKGRREGRRWRSGLEFWARLCRGCLGSSEALFTRLWVRCSLRRAAGAMPANTGRNSDGVGRRQPVFACLIMILTRKILKKIDIYL